MESLAALNLLALISFKSKGEGVTWLQWLLSFLPHALAAFAVVLLLIALVQSIRKGRLRGRRLATVLAVLLLAVGGAALLALQPWRQSAPPPPPMAPADQWPTFMGNMARTGIVGDAAGPADGQELWTFRDGLNRSPFAATAAVVAGRVYVGSDSGTLYCLAAADGRKLWTYKAATALFAAPVVADGRVYQGEGLHEDTAGQLLCLDADTGAKLWDFVTTSHVEFAPTLHQGRLYFSAGDDGVYCMDAKTGRQIWRWPGAHVDMSPAVTADAVLVGGVYGRPAIYRLDPDDGHVVWKIDTPFGVSGSPSTNGTHAWFGLGNGDFLMSHADPKGAVWCVRVADGEVIWKANYVADAVLTSVALTGGRVLFASRDGHVYCADAASGRQIWKHDAGEPIVSSPAVAGGRVYFGSTDGQVHCLDVESGNRLWSYDTSQVAFNTDVAVFASPAIADGRLYIGGSNFYFFCLGEKSR